MYGRKLILASPTLPNLKIFDDIMYKKDTIRNAETRSLIYTYALHMLFFSVRVWKFHEQGTNFHLVFFSQNC